MANDKSKSDKSSTKSTKTNKPIDDVAKPGESTPSDTSVPIITGRPIIKDPMVLGQEAVNEMEEPKVDLKIPSHEAKKIEMKDSDTVAEIAVKAKAEKEQEEIEKAEADAKAKAAEGDIQSGRANSDIPLVTSAGKKTIQPLQSSGDDEASGEDKEKDSDDKDSDIESKSEGDKVDEKKTEASLPDQPTKDADSKSDSDKATEPTELDALEAEAAKKAEHDANIEKIIESKKYELPITTQENRRSRRAIILGVILAIILSLAWVNIALDAGLIQLNGVKPVTHFFSN